MFETFTRLADWFTYQVFSIEKVSDLEQMMSVGVINTPGVSVDRVLRHFGSVPSARAIEQMLTA